MTGPWRMVDGPAGVLPVYATDTAMGSSPRPLAVVCHELSPRAVGAGIGASFPALAERLADETGLRVVAGMLRGVGESAGDFSAEGWLEDLDFLIDREIGPEDGAWLVGYGLGGVLALRHAVTDRRVRGVAVLAAPSDLAHWLADPLAVVERCRAIGVIRSTGFPPDATRWAQSLVSLDPLDAAGRLGDRSFLVVHGSEDAAVPVADARELAGAARTTGTVDLRIVPGAGHGLRTDPRGMATLIGWLERQR
ncbi:MAG: alpha/beta hydrolase family protein [Acidimicrobiales bacterium]